MFSKTYELTLTRNYVSRWGLAEAVRELIQNALDSQSPFVYEFSTEDDGSATLILRSEFTILTPQTLLLGSTSKADDKSAIGSFGEGYKIALLVLTRLGHDVEMRNGDVRWAPRFKFNSKFGEELLVIDETALPTRENRGLTYVVKNLTEDHVAEIRASCLQMQKDVGQVKTTSKGDILLDRPGMLYVHGLFVCKTQLKYGYNVKPEFIRLERDRQTVDSFNLHSLTKDMWFETGEFDAIAKMIDAKVPDLSYAEYDSPEMVKEACYRLFMEQNPGGVAARNQQELKAAISNGMTRVVTLDGPMYACVTTAPSYLARQYTRIPTPKERLEAWYSKARYEMADKHKQAFRELIEESKHWHLA